MNEDERESEQQAQQESAPTQRAGSFGATVKAVFWSFFGVRKRSDYESDAANLNPVHVIFAGIIGAALFILILVTIVRLVVAN